MTSNDCSPVPKPDVIHPEVNKSGKAHQSLALPGPRPKVKGAPDHKSIPYEKLVLIADLLK